jgi:predicted Rossmann fold flavoprotein
MNRQRIIVIGGGPSGLMAAGHAAEKGADTLLLEKMKHAGRKLRLTGKGRCNLTNTAKLDDFLSRFNDKDKFLRHAFSQFFNTELMDFLKNNGLELTTERGGRVFPTSGRAPDVLATLQDWIADCGVHLKYSTPVEKLLINDGRISGVVSRGRKFPCASVVLATGGASYPATGSTGDGYRLAESVGHKIIPIRPALIPLNLKGGSTKILDGVSLKNTNVRLLINGAMRREAFGEVAFTKTGIGGPVTLSLSRQAVDAIDAGHKVALSLDLKPALDQQKLAARISRDLTKRKHETYKSFLRGLLPKQMVSICMIKTGISGKRIAGSITAEERKHLINWIKGFRLNVNGYRQLSEAIVTAGGIATNEIDPKTLESRVVKGLYIAGEVMDVDADTGGYNLQAAFSTGRLAGLSAAYSLLED